MWVKVELRTVPFSSAPVYRTYAGDRTLSCTLSKSEAFRFLVDNGYLLEGAIEDKTFKKEPGITWTPGEDTKDWFYLDEDEGADHDNYGNGEGRRDFFKTLGRMLQA